MTPYNNNPSHKKPTRREAPREEYAIVLDVYSPSQFSDEVNVQAIGTSQFTLLELAPKPGVELKMGDKIYIGEGKRDEIQFIKRAIWPDKLSNDAKAELEFVLYDIVKEKEEHFVNFFNNAGAITIRRHSFELIPGIGKKHLRELLNARDDKLFESFEDIEKRCSFLGNPIKAVVQRIIQEMNDQEDFKLFVRK
ncbi:MAG: DUF655 domain-containing protein [Candidatus Nanoarchaeia archaeon]